MNPLHPKAAFIQRFDDARSVILRFQLRYGLCWVVFVAVCGLALLAACDYCYEWPRTFRAVGLGVLGIVVLSLMAAKVLAPIMWWSRPRTAVEIERRFPQLGQRVRTVVQFSGRDDEAVAAEGVMPALVAALEQEADARSRPLDLCDVVPKWKLRVGAGAAAVLVLGLACGALFNWEMRVATQRALLSDRPYTTLAVAPGDVFVDRGQDVSLSLLLSGRVDRQVVLYTRGAGTDSARWHERELTGDELKASGNHLARYETTLGKIAGPMEYRVAAGPADSDVYRVSVRYPLAITKFEAVLNPPAYTGLKPETVAGGDLEVVEGSSVRFRVTFDRPEVESLLVVRDPPSHSKQDEAVAEQARVPLVVDGGAFVADMQFADDKLYRIVAAAREGSPLPDKEYRVRVRKDHAPRLRFESPAESLEVHSIAELLMRVSASDDFGLAKLGIVFQVNNGEEQTLLVRDFPTAETVDRQSGPSRMFRTAVDQTLLLEQLNLTPTDAVTYYAFAEDNYPGGAKRTETELRFVDIRPFKRIYKIGGT